MLVPVAGAALLVAEERKDGSGPFLVHVGQLTLKPTAFLDAIGMSRSEVTPDSVLTKFGNIPLNDGPGESLGTLRHSRLMLNGDLPVGVVKFSGYLESDFMNFTPGQSPYHWRQYWIQAQIGKWEILGGKAWSLLRPNRVGTGTDRDTMNTDVIDPAYHVGLLGTRVRQIRLTRPFGTYRAAIAWEGDGNVMAKVVRDKNRQHWEAGGFGGRFGRRGVTASAVISLNARFRVVTQQYWSKRAAYQAMGVVPSGVNGLSTLDGVEAQVTKYLELYSYGGLVYAARGEPAGNRVVRQWTVGLNQRFVMSSLRSTILMSLQYSQLDRAIWGGRQGAMEYLMYRVRYTFN